MPGRVPDRKMEATPPPDATVKIAIGDAANIIAEYSGLREAMRRAVRTADKIMVIEVDSDVVARQMAEMDTWVCRAENLRDLHDDSIKRRLGAIPEHPTEAEVEAILRKWAKAPQAERKELISVMTLRTHPDKGGHAGAFRLITERKDAVMA